ncbi:GATA-type transcription factor NDAI_0H01740 [Naumovozyma dairenensis CBS 421]|uniref:GATA-type domain-containing protein n=1 Tax=Naumovozyma dairenensis (strain ATCC 10597 / BCRC 20456 / CBS 421 / NBRC 0211 / NRRL Y-12639) TaxID=1071378 RepID=G0WEY7_NAUDC|nr:hypothetical protein NDAI_0H01740 [Naumovozyma dairenensis CBS 421]CCD26348.1 hypothetical protein NDAI_0H01740 [Naumovozyma dairenensis CBS 421]
MYDTDKQIRLILEAAKFVEDEEDKKAREEAETEATSQNTSTNTSLANNANDAELITPPDSSTGGSSPSMENEIATTTVSTSVIVVESVTPTVISFEESSVRATNENDTSTTSTSVSNVKLATPPELSIEGRSDSTASTASVACTSTTLKGLKNMEIFKGDSKLFTLATICGNNFVKPRNKENKICPPEGNKEFYSISPSPYPPPVSDKILIPIEGSSSQHVQQEQLQLQEGDKEGKVSKKRKVHFEDDIVVDVVSDDAYKEPVKKRAKKQNAKKNDSGTPNPTDASAATTTATTKVKSPTKTPKSNPSAKCGQCRDEETPEWRRGPYGKNNKLCNKCGLFYRKLCKRFGDYRGTAILRFRFRGRDYKGMRDMPTTSEELKDEYLDKLKEDKTLDQNFRLIEASLVKKSKRRKTPIQMVNA